MSSNVGIQNYSEMEDKDKAYVVKLLAIMAGAVLSGIVTGISYDENGGIALIGFGIFFIILIGMSIFIKQKFDLKEMTDVQIVRHGIAIGFLSYIFLWVTIFQFVYF